MVRVGEKHAFQPQGKMLCKISGPTPKRLAFSHLNPIAWSKPKVFSISLLFPHLRNHCWGFQQGGTWQNLQVRAHKKLEQGLVNKSPGWNFRLSSARGRQCLAPSFLAVVMSHSTGVPRHSTGPPSPWTHNSYPPQSITGALGLRLGEGERKHIFITVIKSDTFSVWRPRSCISPPSGFLLSCCVFWTAYPGVCCVNVHGNVMHSLHPEAVRNSLYVPPPPPLSSTRTHSGSLHWSESWPGPQFPATLLSPDYLRKGRQNCTTC